jgi:hypothetical protein
VAVWFVFIGVALGSPPALLRETCVQANNNVDPEKLLDINGITAEELGKPTLNRYRVLDVHQNREGSEHEDTR